MVSDTTPAVAETVEVAVDLAAEVPCCVTRDLRTGARCADPGEVHGVTGCDGGCPTVASWYCAYHVAELVAVRVRHSRCLTIMHLIRVIS